ncbi:MAG: HpcH/HpaI aldolase family protein [Janthinobacterium lividum]
MLLKQKLKNGERVAGVMLAANSPAIVELLGIIGFDFVLIDLQHTPASWETAEHLVRAARAAHISPLIRVPDFDETQILKALDIGAEGLVLPFVRTVEDVEKCASAALFHPRGNRSICSQVRTASYGQFDGKYLDVLSRLNDDLLLIGLIEDLTGIANLAEIVQHPALDVIAVGRGDLAALLGTAGQQDNPRLVQTVNDAVDVIQSAPTKHCQLGVFTYNTDELSSWTDKGAKFFCHMSETSLLARAGRDYLQKFKG